MSSSKVFKATEGVLSRVTDLTLYVVAFQFSLIGKRPTMAGVNRAGDEAWDIVLNEVNYKSIKRALRELKRKGLVKSVHRGLQEPEITAAGRKRLASLIPQYQKKRPWDKNIYLVTYDIPVSHNWERASFRDYLKTIGCGLLQESIWVTPYNPTRLVRQFVSERGLEGTVLVSILGKDGSIGEMSLEELLERVYRLSDLNDRYADFLLQCNAPGKSRAALSFQYLSVLQDDPQLPFELLPEWWLGEEAYDRYVKMTVVTTTW